MSTTATASETKAQAPACDYCGSRYSTPCLWSGKPKNLCGMCIGPAGATVPCPTCGVQTRPRDLSAPVGVEMPLSCRKCSEVADAAAPRPEPGPCYLCSRHVEKPARGYNVIVHSRCAFDA